MGLANRLIVLWLAVSSTAIAAPPAPHEHVVQSGQTLAKIAKRYRVDLDALCEANDLKKSSKLQPGLRLTIPNDEEEVDTDGSKASTGSREARSTSARKSEITRRVNAQAGSYSQYVSRPARRGWVHVMGHHGDWQGQLVGKSGKLLPKAAAALSRLLAWPRTDFQMNPRILVLLAKVSDTFGGRTLRVVSGYRRTSYSAESKHPMGRACDFHVLGVPNTALRDFVRTLDNVGVGYYPNSTFVHLDARDHDAYWIDYAGPGERPRYNPHRIARASQDGSTPSNRGAAMKGANHDESTSAADLDAPPREAEGDAATDAASGSSATASAQKRLIGDTQARELRHTPERAGRESTTGPERPATEHIDL